MAVSVRCLARTVRDYSSPTTRTEVAPALAPQTDTRNKVKKKKRQGKEREGKGREGKGREGKGREGNGTEGKGRERNGRERNGKKQEKGRKTAAQNVRPSKSLAHTRRHAAHGKLRSRESERVRAYRERASERESIERERE